MPSFARWPFACLALAAAASQPLAADDRGTELMRYECSSALSRRDVTLFANGTVRLRQGPRDEPALYLDELLPEELASYLDRLREARASDLSAAAFELPANAPGGDWVEECEIRLELPGDPPATWSFSVYEIPPLAVASVIHVAEDLADFTRSPEAPERLPEGYRPRPGDLLRAVEGGSFRVVGLTGDRLGVELEEVGTPVMIIVPVAELGDLFSALLERGGR